MEPKFYGAAANYNAPGGFKINPRIIILGVVAVIVIIILMVATAVVSGINAGPGRDLATLVAQETDIQSTADKNRDNITNGDLKKANADFSIMLLSNSMVLTTQLSKVYGFTAVPKDVAALNTDTAMIATLKTAKQTGNFDTVYAALLRKKIADMLVAAHRIEGETTNANLKPLLQNTIKMLSGLDDEVAAAKL